MDATVTTKDGRPIAAWLLKANPDVFDLEAAFGRFGEVTSWSLKESYRVDLMEPGDRVFLYQTAGRAKRAFSGIVGVGEVTGEVLSDAGGGDLWRDRDKAAEVRPYVPVVVRPLRSRISRADMLSDPVLREMEVFRAKQVGNPNVIRPEELERLEAFDLETIEPTQEQLDASSEELGWGEGDVDLGWVTLHDGATSYTIYASDEVEDAWCVEALHEEEDGDRTELLGDGLGWAQALGALRQMTDEVGRSAPLTILPPESSDEDLELQPVAHFEVDDGWPYLVIRTADDQFEVLGYESDDSEHPTILRSAPTLGEAFDAACEMAGEPELFEDDEEE